MKQKFLNAGPAFVVCGSIWVVLLVAAKIFAEFYA